MFIPLIERLGTGEQIAKWLPPSVTFQVIGSYVQTEIGHGKVYSFQLVCLYNKYTKEKKTDRHYLI